MVSITHKDDQIVESKEVAPISSPENTYDSNNDELNDTEEEVNVCDTCGVQGFINMLAICHKCGVGAEHTYCMAVNFIPERWLCYDCVEDTGSIKKNSKSSTGLFEMGESGFKNKNDSNTQKSSETVGLDLNIEPNLNLKPNIDLNLDPSINLTMNRNLDLILDNNLDLTLDCGSSYRSSSTSNCQAHKRRRASQNPLLGQGSLEEEEDQDAKRHRVDTRLSL